MWTPTASTQVIHPSTFLVWLGYVGKNGRTVYRSSSETYYLYYHDWGSNLGSNWVISTDYNKTEVLLCSTKLLYNLEVSDLSVLTQYGTSRQFLCWWCSSEDILQTFLLVNRTSPWVCFVWGQATICQNWGKRMISTGIRFSSAIDRLWSFLFHWNRNCSFMHIILIWMYEK